MRNILITTLFCTATALSLTAQSESADSIKSRTLQEVVVEGQLQRTSATVTTYIPTSRQKNSAQTAVRPSCSPIR